MTVSARSSVAAQLFEGDDAVDHPVAVQVLRGLDAGRERLAVELLVDPGPEEADQRARLGDGDVTQRAPRRENAAGRRVAQVDQIGQVRLFVQPDGRGDLDHLQKRDGALLHAGTAGARRGQQREPLGRRPLHGGGDPFGRRHPDRPAEEVELADHHRHPAPEYPPLAGQHRFVEAGGVARVRRVRGVGLADRQRQRRAVPADEGALVQHRVRSCSVVMRLTREAI